MTAPYILGYSASMVGASLLPFFWGGAGPLYLGVSLVLGATFIALACRLSLRGETPSTPPLPLLNPYLALLFVALPVSILVASRKALARRDGPNVGR